MRSLIHRSGVVSALGLALSIAVVGCGSEREPAETIEGQTPADYREQMEENIAQPIPGGATGSASPSS